MTSYIEFWKEKLGLILSKIDSQTPAEFTFDISEIAEVGDREATGYSGFLSSWLGNVEANKDSAVFRHLKKVISQTPSFRPKCLGQLDLQIRNNSTLDVTYQPITFDLILSKYVSIGDNIKKEEVYKWELVQKFQRHWRQYQAGALSFREFYRLFEFRNLVYKIDSAILGHISNEKPDELGKMFEHLLDESRPLPERINEFRQSTSEIYKLLPGHGAKTEIEERTIATLLAFGLPDYYTFFKSSFYTTLCKAMGIKPERAGAKLLHYYQFVEQLVNNFLPKHPEIIRKKEELLGPDAYPDKQNKLLAQDILYLTLRESTEPSESDQTSDEPEVAVEPITPKMTNNPQNIILYGPPGTGKTYSTIDRALSIVDPAFFEANADDREALRGRFQDLLIKDWKKPVGQIAFATFHQSMSYEDFIEGIKPDVQGGGGDVTYTIEPGLFKRICAHAQNQTEAGDNFEEVYDSLLEEIENNDGSLTLTTLSKKKEFKIYENSNGNIRFHANKENAYPGVIRKDFIAEYVRTGKVLDWPSYTKAVGEHLKAKHGFKPVAQVNQATGENKQYVLIIDEINRGNIAQIFGELITLIEQDKRNGMPEQASVMLPYSKHSFSVPSNLSLIGTMNTADRSVEALDTALRRRFRFIEMMPLPEKLQSTADGIDLPKLLTAINNRLEALVDRDHTIGHAWLIGCKNVNDLRIAFQDRIIPLLKEFFYNDHSKIGLVIGEAFFEPTTTPKPGNLFATFSRVDKETRRELSARQVFHIRMPKESDLAQAFRDIYEIKELANG